MGTAALTSIFLAAASTERTTALRLLGDKHAALQATTYKLKEALSARDEFLSIASHELRTPLSALTLQITGVQQALRESSTVTDQSRHRIDRAAVQVERLIRVVENLLDVSRIRAGRLQLQRETFELSSVVRHMANELQEQATRAGCTVSVIAPALITGSWDRFRLEQVVTNLLTNAFKYGAGKPVDVMLEASESTAVLRVRDHGIGIAPDAVDRIFERFERLALAHQRRSRGVGLYIARQVIDAHAGAIRVESSSAAGSTFIIELPRHPHEQTQTA
jgi:signal transduction histidine kinase